MGESRAPRRRRTAGLATVTALASIALVATATRAFVAHPVVVESASMAPTLDAGDVVLVSRRDPDLEQLEHGDLVVFRSPGGGRPALKRVVGLPGEDLVVRDGVLHRDGRPVAEPWVDHDLVDGYWSRTFAVPAAHVFVLGDNRGNSVDSRDYGAVPVEELTGEVLVRLWPVG